MECVCKQFTRGTTPSFTFDMKVHLGNIKEFYVTFVQLDTIIVEKTLKDIKIIDEDSIKVNLTTEESLLFSDKYPVKCQLMIKYINDVIITSEPPLIFEVNKVLREV
jgi:hypothetical protein